MLKRDITLYAVPGWGFSSSKKKDAIIMQNEFQLMTLNPNRNVVNIDKAGHASFLGFLLK